MSERSVKKTRSARRMTPAEAEFDVTDEGEVSFLLASHSGPVLSFGVSGSDQPEVSSSVRSMGSLRTRP